MHADHYVGSITDRRMQVKAYGDQIDQLLTEAGPCLGADSLIRSKQQRGKSGSRAGSALACAFFSLRRSAVVSALAVAGLFAQSMEVHATELRLRAQSVSESQQNASVRIDLSQASTSVVRVRFATTPDTATAGKDFYGVYELITFNPGETVKRVPVAILNDTELEGDERIGTRIWGAEGDGVRIVQSQASIKILDDDGSAQPQVSVRDVRVGENAEKVDIEIRLNVPASQAATMVYATTAATATPGQDFYGTSGTLRFESGEISKTIAIQLIDDAVSEGDEFFKFSLHKIRGVGQGATVATITLVDDDDSASSFTCLDDNSIENTDTSWFGRSLTGRIRPGSVPDNTAVDLRGARIAVHEAEDDAIDADGDPVVDSRWGLVQFDTATNPCVAGGEVTSNNPYNITWAENYDTEGIGRGYRLGTTRNHTAVDMAQSTRPTVSGIYFFNLHDGPRFNGSKDWRLENSWGDYTRDDCVENDEIASGHIYDTLFDGCYSGYSNRATAEFDDNGDRITGIGDTVTFESVLLRMEMMPGPHKACERTYLYFDADRNPYDASACVEREVYGTGQLFKLVDQGDASGSINPMFRLIDSVFVVEQVPNRAGETRADFPPASRISECRNVTVIYRGAGDYPGRLPPDGCYTLLTGEQGQAFWTRAVADWHARHPDVAPERKNRSGYGDLTFPRPAFNEPEG